MDVLWDWVGIIGISDQFVEVPRSRVDYWFIEIRFRVLDWFVMVVGVGMKWVHLLLLYVRVLF